MAAAPSATAQVTAIRDVIWRDRVVVTGEVQAMRVRPWRQTAYTEVTLDDGTGRLLVWFSGRRHIPGINVGTRMTVEGTVGELRGHLAILNPRTRSRLPTEHPERDRLAASGLPRHRLARRARVPFPPHGRQRASTCRLNPASTLTAPLRSTRTWTSRR